jgi:hypothetical protein
MKKYLQLCLLVSGTFLFSCNQSDRSDIDSGIADSTTAALTSYSIEDIHQEMLYRSEIMSLADSIPSGDTPRKYVRLPVPGLQDVPNERLFNYYVSYLKERKVIYGADNRKDIIYGPDDRGDIGTLLDTGAKKNVRVVVALIEKNKLKLNGNGTYRLRPTGDYKTLYKLCDDERFKDQPVFANCSGFAIAPDLIASAGHCISKDNYKNYVAIFDLTLLNVQQYLTAGIPADLVFQITDVIDRKYTAVDDYAVIKVNRPIPQDRISKVQRAADISANSFYVLGFPCGIPMKCIDDANLRNTDDPLFFVINSDTYGGNSGSPVFDMDTDSVVGILVRGNQDFKIETAVNCSSSVQCPEKGCRGEDVSRNKPLLRHIK